MKKRFTRFLSCLLVFVLVVPFFCVTSHAVLPLGFAQSVLASYVASTGYKMWQDQAVGDSILQSLATLYSDTFLPQSGLDEVSLSQFALQSLLDANRIGIDNSGNVVVSKAAADIFQQFSDWLQTEYNIPDNTDTPTEVVFPESDGMYQTPNGAVFQYYSFTITPSNTNSLGSNKLGSIIGHNDIYNADTYLGSSALSGFYITHYKTANSDYICYLSSSSGLVNVFSFYYNRWNSLQNLNARTTLNSFTMSTNDLSIYRDIVVTDIDPSGYNVSDLVAKPLAPGLGLSIAQTVVDQAAKAGEDDAVVIGVGAQAGATAQEIADLIAQGINARTLDPTITITAEAVIDTPVQPYPDVDGLGLPTLGAALVSRFPFCVPWDFVDTLRILNADPIPPVFDVTLVPASVASSWGVTGNYTLHVDLTSAEYAKLFTALRWGTLVGFCLGLALLTKRLIWTA